MSISSQTADHQVDLLALTALMDSQRLGSGPITDATLLAGGTQNILLHFTRGGRGYVLRRPPQHLRANSNETMRRELRVPRLSARPGRTQGVSSVARWLPAQDTSECFTTLVPGLRALWKRKERVGRP
jgi:hypothetical protein